MHTSARSPARETAHPQHRPLQPPHGTRGRSWAAAADAWPHAWIRGNAEEQHRAQHTYVSSWPHPHAARQPLRCDAAARTRKLAWGAPALLPWYQTPPFLLRGLARPPYPDSTLPPRMPPCHQWELMGSLGVPACAAATPTLRPTLLRVRRVTPPSPKGEREKPETPEKGRTSETGRANQRPHPPRRYNLRQAALHICWWSPFPAERPIDSWTDRTAVPPLSLSYVASCAPMTGQALRTGSWRPALDRTYGPVRRLSVHASYGTVRRRADITGKYRRLSEL